MAEFKFEGVIPGEKKQTVIMEGHASEINISREPHFDDIQTHEYLTSPKLYQTSEDVTVTLRNVSFGENKDTPLRKFTVLWRNGHQNSSFHAESYEYSNRNSERVIVFKTKGKVTKMVAQSDVRGIFEDD